MADPIKYAEKAYRILSADEKSLRRVDEYYKGDHLKPYTPPGANQEFKDLAEKCITNWCPNLVSTPLQALFVDNFRRDDSEVGEDTKESPVWEHWQRSRLAHNQAAIYESALKFGHSFTITEKDDKGKVITKGLSSLRTVALYDDPSTDFDPVAAVYFKRFATSNLNEDGEGVAYVWDETYKYELRFGSDNKYHVKSKKAHGADECPVTRFCAYRDLEGRTWGVIEPMIPIQDRINQTIFDLLVAQTYTSFTVRYVTGMAPPMKMKMDPETNEWIPETDADGNPIPDQMQINASRWFYAEDENVKFGNLPAGDLGGFINAAELAVRHLSALSQTPPHFLLGEIANISAEALEAAETALSRKVEAFRVSFGESWERVMRLASQLLNDSEGADDFSGEVVWRDMGASSLAQSADALGKFAEALEIPKRGLWNRVPKVTKSELATWARLREEDDKEQQLLLAAQGQNSFMAHAMAPAPNAFKAQEMQPGQSPTATPGAVGQPTGIRQPKGVTNFGAGK